MKSKSILVLGAGGFVGGHLVNRLSQEDGIIINAVGHYTPQQHVLQGVNYYQANLDDIDLLNCLLPECKIVFHFACASTPSTSALHPVFEAEYNLTPTLRFLEVLQDYPSILLIYISTGGAVYGDIDPNISFIKESNPLTPLSYYGAGKAAIEQFVMALCNQQQRPGMILRPANLYGPQQTQKPGFGIIPTIFNCINEGQPVQIWGDGENVRDYIFIDDFIDLCLTLVKSTYKFNHAKIYNVGSEQGHTLNQLCELIEQVAGIQVQREYHVSRSVDVKRVVLDCNQICRDYGWKTNTDLLSGLQRTWQWFKSRDLS